MGGRGRRRRVPRLRGARDSLRQRHFAGYISLDDTSTWLNFTDRLLQHGRTISGLSPLDLRAHLDYYWHQYGYPVGAFPPLGIGHTIVRTDSAWLIQPYLAFIAAMLALGLYALLARLIPSRPWRALAAFVAAQPALLYGYYALGRDQGGGRPPPFSCSSRR